LLEELDGGEGRPGAEPRCDVLGLDISLGERAIELPELAEVGGDAIAGALRLLQGPLLDVFQVGAHIGEIEEPLGWVLAHRARDGIGEIG
jgi:hypothetical protein